MKKYYTLIITAFICLGGLAQTTHDIDVSSNQFTPSTLTISVGDSVTWTNTGGTHNVNGTLATYPNNPEGFGNQVGAGWVYGFRFTIPGTYDYRCDPHFSLGMAGQIIVQGTSINEAGMTPLSLSLYPNPVSNQLILDLEGIKKYAVAEIITPVGQVVSKASISKGANTVDVSSLSGGVYFARITDGDRVITKRFLVR